LLGALVSLMQYELILWPLRLEAVNRADNSLVLLRGTLVDGQWKLQLADPKDGLIPVYYEWRTGPLAAAGYIGVLGIADDKWIVRYWKQLWMS
jgi:hypothetical protein